MYTNQRVGTYAFIQNAKGEVLIVQRAKDDTHPGMWELPGGGVDLGESPMTAVIREAKEEVALDVRVLLPFSVVVQESSKVQQVFRITYLCTQTDSTQPITLSREHIAHRWVTIETILTDKPSEFLVQITQDFQTLKQYGT
jgi:mutator protein MutT